MLQPLTWRYFEISSCEDGKFFRPSRFLRSISPLVRTPGLVVALSRFRVLYAGYIGDENVCSTIMSFDVLGAGFCGDTRGFLAPFGKLVL